MSLPLTRIDARQADGAIVLLPECTITIRSNAIQPETTIIVSEPLTAAPGQPLGHGQRMVFRWRWFERFGARPAQLAVQVRHP